MSKNIRFDLWYDIVEFFTKWWSYIFYIAMGYIGKIGWDIVNKKKLSFWYLAGSGLIASFIGYLASMWCHDHSPNSAPIIVPIATLMSRDMMIYIHNIDHQKLLNNILNITSKSKKDDSSK